MGAQSDPATWERHYGDTTAAERQTIDGGRCVLPCNSAVCEFYGSEEMIRSDGALLRPDGRRAWCAGCSVGRISPCMRNRCGFQCHVCHTAYRKNVDPRAPVEGVPAICGQKHSFASMVVEDELGGLDHDNADIPWVPLARKPHDRFVVGIQRNKGWVERAAREVGHKSWMTSIKDLWPKPPRNAREAFGIPDDHFFAVNFRVKDNILEDLWEGDRQRFFDWIATQRIDLITMVNFSPWQNLPRLLAFQSLKRMFITYRELTERGMSVAFEYDSSLPWFLMKYQDDFLVRNGVMALHESFQTMRSGGQRTRVMGMAMRAAKKLPPQMTVMLSGIADPQRAAATIALYRHGNHDVYLSNVDVYVRAGHWKIPPGQKISRKRADKDEIFCMGIQRWRDWTDKLLPPVTPDTPKQ